MNNTFCLETDLKDKKGSLIYKDLAETYRSTNNSAKWIPCSFIKPVEKVVEPMIYHVMCSSVVKPVKINQHLH
jgi:hypothetical protein